MLLLLADIALVVVAARFAGAVLARVGQPPVMGEILVGVALGPSLLGAVAPEVSATLFPAATLDHLALIGGVGLSLFMFLMGLEFDLATVGRDRHAVSRISACALVLPFAAGLLLAIPLYASHPPPDAASASVFALFIATAVSLTAFPVLLRIISDRGIGATRVAALAILAAALLDLAGWVLLTLTLALVRDDGLGGFFVTIGGFAALVVALAFLGRPALRVASARLRANRRAGVPWTMGLAAMAVGCGALADAIGLHGILGAFLFGLLCPRDAVSVGAVRRTLWPATVGVLMPIYFVNPGFGVDVGAVGSQGLGIFVLIVVAACAGKWGGAAVGARRAGLSWRDAHAIGILLNTRGIVELMVLAIGFEAGILTPVLYSELVLMALLTTLMTGPLLSAFRSDLVPAPAANRALVPGP